MMGWGIGIWDPKLKTGYCPEKFKEKTLWWGISAFSRLCWLYEGVGLNPELWRKLDAPGPHFLSLAQVKHIVPRLEKDIKLIQRKEKEIMVAETKKHGFFSLEFHNRYVGMLKAFLDLCKLAAKHGLGIEIG